MQALRTHVAGIDVHKAILAITILKGDASADPKAEQFSCSTFTEDLMAMAIVLKDHGVTEVAMESTGVYWLRHDVEERSCSYN